MEAQRELELKGIGVSPGIASGPVLLLKAEDAPLPEYAISADDVAREMVRLEAALLETGRQLHEVQQRVGEALGSESAGRSGGYLEGALEAAARIAAVLAPQAPPTTGAGGARHVEADPPQATTGH